MIVVDASAVLEVLTRSARAPAIEARLFAADAGLHAPHLLDVEVMQVLRRLAATGDLSLTQSVEALEVFTAIPLRRWPHLNLVARIWELRNTLTAYDAAYVALAEALDAELLTCDTRLARAPGHHARIARV